MRRCRIHAFRLWDCCVLLFPLATLIMGCSSETKPTGELPTIHSNPSMPAKPLVIPAVDQAPEPDPDEELQRRLQEAKEHARRTEEQQKAEFEARQAGYAWSGQFKAAKKDRYDRTREISSNFTDQIIALMQSPAIQQARLADRIQDQLSSFVNNNASIPLRPELRQAGLEYIQSRLAIEREFQGQFRQMLAHPPTEVAAGDVVEARQELLDIEKLIAGLLAVQPLITALDDPTSAVASSPPVESPPALPPALTESGSRPASSATPSVTSLTSPPPSTPPFKASSPSWQVVADPGPRLPQIPDRLPYTELSACGTQVVLYPPGPATFILAGVDDSMKKVAAGFENVIIGDLRTGKLAGAVRNVNVRAQTTIMPSRPALSTDGRWIAFCQNSPNSIHIVEARTGKLKRSIPIRESSVAKFFPTSQQLLVIDMAYEHESGKLIEISSGNELVSFTLPGKLEHQPGLMAVSPGGRYFAVGQQAKSRHLPDHVVLFDLTTGKVAGEIWPIARESPNHATVFAFAFSPDGDEFGAVVGYPNPVNLLSQVQKLVIWKMSTGREVQQVAIDNGNRGRMQFLTPEPFQWFPDREAVLLYQTLVTNRSDGKLLDVVHTDGAMFSNHATKVLDDYRVLRATHMDKLIVQEVNR